MARATSESILFPFHQHRSDRRYSSNHFNCNLRFRLTTVRWFHADDGGGGVALGYELMGVVVEVGKQVKTLRQGDRVVIPFTIGNNGDVKSKAIENCLE